MNLGTLLKGDLTMRGLKAVLEEGEAE